MEEILPVNIPVRNEAGVNHIKIHEIEISQPINDILAADIRTGTDYSSCRILVRLHGFPLGSIDLNFCEGHIPASRISSAIWDNLETQINQHLLKDHLPPVNGPALSAIQSGDQFSECASYLNLPEGNWPFISVVICTHERVTSLKNCLSSIMDLDYPSFEILLVDNAPGSDPTRNLARLFHQALPQLRYILEPRPGLSIARNTGLYYAKGEIIAFTDDDVRVDRNWLKQLAAGFKLGKNVGCVTGLVCPGEIETQAQELMEQYGGMGKGFEPQIFDMKNRAMLKNPLIPFSAGWFGVGANMAFKTSVLRSIGGFDPATGAGTPTNGGEDLAMFFNIVTQPYQLVYNPGALIRHFHRREFNAFQKQIFNYGTGLTAYLASIISANPRLLWRAIKTIPAGVSYLVRSNSKKNQFKQQSYPKRLVWLERLGWIYGPIAYARSKWNFKSHQYLGLGVMPASLELKLEARTEQAVELQSLLIKNLINCFEDLSGFLVSCIKKQDWLNAYLLAVGINQIVEDYIKTENKWLAKGSRFIKRSKIPAVVHAAKAIDFIQDLLVGLTEKTTRYRRLESYQAKIAGLVQILAEASLGYLSPDVSDLVRTFSDCLQGLQKIEPDLANKVLRLPSCFRSFDQHPDDVKALVEKFATQFPDRKRPLVVIGLRTSGSYLAPLLSAYLRANGYEGGLTFTIRPDERPNRHLKLTLQRAAKQNGLALLIDDPPITGHSLSATVDQLVRSKFPKEAIVLLLALFETVGQVPGFLSGYHTIMLTWEDWSVHKRCEKQFTEMALSQLFTPGLQVKKVEKIQQPKEAQPRRGHIHVLYRVEITNQAGRSLGQKYVFIEGVGLGYFGHHALAINQAIQGYFPSIFGVKDGLLYREWMPDDQRFSTAFPNREKEMAAQFATYVTTQEGKISRKFRHQQDNVRSKPGLGGCCNTFKRGIWKSQIVCQ